MRKETEKLFDEEFDYLEAYQDDIERVNFKLLHKEYKQFIDTHFVERGGGRRIKKLLLPQFNWH